MKILILFWLGCLALSMVAEDLDEILRPITSNTPKNLSQFFLNEKVMIGIETESFTLPESYYSARQGFYLLEKFSNYYELKSIIDQKSQTSGETIHYNLTVSSRDLKRDTVGKLHLSISILKIEKKRSINKLIIREIKA